MSTRKASFIFETAMPGLQTGPVLYRPIKDELPKAPGKNPVLDDSMFQDRDSVKANPQSVPQTAPSPFCLAALDIFLWQRESALWAGGQRSLPSQRKVARRSRDGGFSSRETLH